MASPDLVENGICLGKRAVHTTQPRTSIFYFFWKVITLGTIERGTVDWEEESITKKFVEFVEERLRS